MLKSVFSAIRHKYLNVSLRSGPNRVQIIERPALWMSDGELDQLVSDLREIASSTLPSGALTYGVFSKDRERLENTILTLVYSADGSPIAFNALAILNIDLSPKQVEVLHLGLVMVHSEHRSKNLSWVLYGLTCFLIFVRRQFRPTWVSNVTQVPAVIGMVSEIFSDVYPVPDPTRQKLEHLQIARRIMGEHRHVFGVGRDADFDEARFVITNSYTGGSDDLKKTWEQAPKHRLEKYNTFCQDCLDYDRGDDVLQLGRIDTSAISSYLRRQVPGSALFGLMATGAFVAAHRALLPILYWGDTTREWSILRPVKGAKK